MENCDYGNTKRDTNYYNIFHCHSEYSLLDSATKYQDYIDLAVKYGQRALSISEHGKPSNWTEKWAACKEAGIKYIHSVEIYMTESLEPKVRDNYHTVLMAKNMDGVLELNKLISLSTMPDHFYHKNRISFDEFLNMSDNIISTSACLASPLYRLPRDHPRYMELAKKYTFLEVQPHIHPEQKEFNAWLAQLSKEIGTPLIAGTDTHSSSAYKSECRDVLLSKMMSKSRYDSDDESNEFDLTYKTYDELVDMFKNQGALSEGEYMEAIANTRLLEDLVDDIELDTSIKYPILYGTAEEDSRVFVERTYKMFEEKVQSGIIPQEQVKAFEDAIKEELEVFEKLGMNGFMLSMSELVCWCREQGMTIGPGRGSVGGSRVAYVTDIIDVNPEQWHTVFSRFCNEHRKEIGDIDIDCIETDRPGIFKYIVGRFGTRKTARVASFGTIQEKGAIDDIGRYLARKWKLSHPNDIAENPWSIQNVVKIKDLYAKDPDKAKAKYPELFYYFDGLVDVKVSQSIHAAGIVISPITIDDNYGYFEKDGEMCMMLDMDNIHDYTGLAKYDFLLLKTLQVIRDAFNYAGEKYPRSHEIDWYDENVWDNMLKSPVGLFQFESPFAFDSLKKFKPKSIFDLSIVTACIRPSGSSYRDLLLARIPHHNPSAMIDDLLSDNLGYLIYQEDVIKFLQQICGLPGGEADNVRRAIARKKKARLDEALPAILDGYCNKSTKSRDESIKEANEFIQILKDSADYMFGYNHSVEYCTVTYLCGYLRTYHPLEFVTAFLNNAANDRDIETGSDLANRLGFNITMPKWGISKSTYSFDRIRRIISKGLSSIKYMGDDIAEQMYDVATSGNRKYFIHALRDLFEKTSINTRQIEILIAIDFFSDFGNQRELLKILDVYINILKRGNAKQINKTSVESTPLYKAIQNNSDGFKKDGSNSKFFKITNMEQMMIDIEDAVKGIGMRDVDTISKIKSFYELMGYFGYFSGLERDRRRLFVVEVYPLHRKRDGAQFGYSIITRSVGSGKQARFTVFNRTYSQKQFNAGDIIYCKRYERDGEYFTLFDYDKE